MAKAGNTANIIASSGPIPGNYQVIGMVFGYSLKEAEGCQSRIDILGAFAESTERLKESAISAGGNAVINIGYQQRDTQTANCAAQGRAASEVYAWGTAVRV